MRVGVVSVRLNQVTSVELCGCDLKAQGTWYCVSSCDIRRFTSCLKHKKKTLKYWEVWWRKCAPPPPPRYNKSCSSFGLLQCQNCTAWLPARTHFSICSHCEMVSRPQELVNCEEAEWKKRFTSLVTINDSDTEYEAWVNEFQCTSTMNEWKTLFWMIMFYK